MRVGIVIGTFGTPAYVHMQLEARKRFYPHLPAIIVNDGNEKINEISELCKKYDAEVGMNPVHFGHARGDMAVFCSGLMWAEMNRLGLLVKISRRYIPLCSFHDWLIRMASSSESNTFGAILPKYNLPIATHFLGMRVNAWLQFRGRMSQYVYGEEPKIVDVEKRMHEWAVQISNSDERTFAGFSLTEGRPAKDRKALWRDKDSVYDYMRQATLWGLNYRPHEFKVN
jgi:hypothetical protein